MELDASGWSGDGTFTQLLIDALSAQALVRFLRVEDAPASRSEPSFSFISNELFVDFAPGTGADPIATLSCVLEGCADIGAPDYSDDGMIQYLRTERVIPPYQTRGYKLIELVRIYKIGSRPRGE